MKFIVLFLILSLVFLFFVLNYLFRTKPLIVKAEVLIKGEKFRVAVAQNDLTRMKGLSGQVGLDFDSGMLFIFDYPGSYGFWMKDMKFPIDIIWLLDEKVVGFTENIPPPKNSQISGLKIYNPPESIDKVLEISAGRVKSLGVKIGDQVKISNLEPAN